MSVVLALVPIAMAISAAVAARQEATAEGHTALTIQTRMKDDQLILQALTSMGCTATVDASGVHARRNQFEFAFTRSQSGVLEARFGPSVAQLEAEAFVRDLDATYAKLVQQQVYQRVVEQSTQHGMVLESERVQPDQSIVLTLRVDGGGAS